MLKRPGWTQERVAASARTSQGTISRLTQRRRKAGLGLALRIEKATEGLVRAEDIPMSPSARRDLRELRKIDEAA